MGTIPVSSEDIRRLNMAKAKRAESIVKEIYDHMLGITGYDKDAAATLTLATIQAMDKI